MADDPSPRSALRALEAGAQLALIGIVVNAVLAAAKVFAGVLGHSYALIADGIESTLDIFSSAILWGGLKIAARPPDHSHPYGHGKAEPLAAIVGAITIIGAAIGLAVESVREILTPHHAPAPFTLVVLVAVIATKEYLSRRIFRANALESSALRAEAWHHRSDALTSLAALVGISAALLGGRGYEMADDWAALFACALIAFNGLWLLKPALYEIMDTAPPSTTTARVREIAGEVAGVVNIEQCRVRKMGVSLYVDLHAGVEAEITVRAGHDIAHEVKRAVRAALPTVADVLVHIEPVDEETTVKTDER